jgi:Transglycosylase-like domain
VRRAVAAGASCGVVLVAFGALILSVPDDMRPAPRPTQTVFVPLERVVPGPTVTVTATAEPRPAPTVTVTREAAVSRSRASTPVHSVNTFLACVIAHESGGDPKAENPTSTASGLYQFLDGTWQAYARESGIGDQYRRASSAPASVQTALAEWVVVNKGRYPWKGTGCGGGT